jgi:glutamine cyclotransferase
MKKLLWSIIPLLSLFIFSCTGNTDTNPEGATEGTAKTVPVMSYSIVSVLPHDTSYYTEGLEFYHNTLLESTGNYGTSKLIQTDLKTGKPVKEIKIDPKQFGEGISVLHDTLFQMTYREHVVNVYSAKDFRKIKELPLNTEGWGMTNDGKSLIVSDGSSNLYFYEPSTFRLLHTQGVTENGNPLVNINELEYVDGFIYANQWQYDYIYKINPNTGEVVAKMDLSDLANKVKNQDNHTDVLNGIAYNPETRKFYITGKYWPQIYEIQFSH